MKQIDIFSDKDFQSLDLEKKQTIANNYFDREMADEEFSKLDAEKQAVIKNNFMNAQLDFDVSDTIAKSASALQEAFKPNPLSANVSIDGAMNEFGANSPTPLTASTATVKQESTVKNDYLIPNSLTASNIDLKAPDIKLDVQYKPEFDDSNILDQIQSSLTQQSVESARAVSKFGKRGLEAVGANGLASKIPDVKALTQDEADFIVGYSQSNRIKDKDSMNDIKKDWENGDYLTATSKSVMELPSVLADSSGEIVQLMNLPSTGVAIAARVSKFEDEYIKNNNGNKPDAAWYAEAITTQSAILLAERFGMKVLGKTIKSTKPKTGAGVAGGIAEGALFESGQEYSEAVSQEHLTQKEDAKSIAQIATSDDAKFSAFLGATMGGAMKGSAEAGSVVFNKLTPERKDTARETYMQDAYNKQMMGSGLVATVDDAGYINFSNNLNDKVKTIQDEFQNLLINHPEHTIPVEAEDSISIQEEVIADAKANGLNVSDNNGLNAIDVGFTELQNELFGNPEQLSSEPSTVDGTQTELTPKGFVEPTQLKEVPTFDIERLVDLEFIPGNKLTADEMLEREELRVQEKNLNKSKTPFNEALKPNGFEDAPIAVQTPTLSTIDMARLHELQQKTDDELTTDEKFELEDLVASVDAKPDVSPTPTIEKPRIGEPEPEAKLDVTDMQTPQLKQFTMQVDIPEIDLKKGDVVQYDGSSADKFRFITSDGTKAFVKVPLSKTENEITQKYFGIDAKDFNNKVTLEPEAKLDVTDTNVGDIKEDPDAVPHAETKKEFSSDDTLKINTIRDTYISKRIKDDYKYLDEVKEQYGEESPQYQNKIAKYKDETELRSAYEEHFKNTFNEMLNDFDSGNMERIHSRLVLGIGFEQYKKGIEAVRSIDFGKTRKASAEAIDKFFDGGYTKFLEERDKASKDVAQKKHIDSLIKMLDGQQIRYKKENMSRKEFLDKVFAEGFTDVVKTKRGAVNRYTLSDGNSAFELKKDEVEYIDILSTAKIQAALDAEEQDEKDNPDKYLSDAEAEHLFGGNRDSNSDIIKQEVQDNANINSGTKEPILEQLQGNVGVEPKQSGTEQDVTTKDTESLSPIKVKSDVRGDGELSNTRVQPDRSKGDSDKRPSSSGRVDTQNQHIISQNDVYASGEVGRFVANIEAIKLLKQNKQHYTKDEKATLSKYTGFGGLGKAFRDLNGQIVDGWSERVRLLEGLLTADELKNVKSGQLDAYYTPIKITQSMWDLSSHLGFKGGTVLEPSMGVGRFIGLLPQNLKGKVAFNGIEIDPTTYKIAAALYENINARNLGFEETNYDSTHDMVIGNPPYGEFKLYDKNKKEYNTLSAHNYFVVKGLDALKEGGILNFVISSSFMDNLDAKTISLINAKANFIGAIRLPSDAFKETGTKVTTDIVVFQKKSDTNIENPKLWATKGTLNGFKINQYFIDNPKMLLGNWVKGYRGGELKANGDFETQLSEAITSLPKDILASDGTIQEHKKSHSFKPSVMYIEGESVFVNIKDGEGVTQKKLSLTPAKAKQFIALRDELLKLVSMQLDTTLNDKEVETQRAKVNSLYDGWVKKNGALNKVMTRSQITKDKDGFLVATLEENYKPDIKADNKAGKEPQDESWSKADILTTRTIRPQTDIKATNAKEALEFAINQKGNVDLEYMAQISDKTQESLIDELLGTIFYDVDAGWVTKDDFLSGDVKTKLENTIDDFHKKALLEVIPKNLEAQDIRVEIGQSWIDAKYIRQFMSEELGYRNYEAHQSSATAKWFINGYSGNFPFTASRVENNAILDSALNNKMLRVTYKDVVSGKTILDEERTDFANSQVQLLKEKFEGWVFQDATRRDTLVSHYNEIKNRFVEKNVEDIIGKYTIPNIKWFTPRNHQVSAVYKSVFGANAMLLNHTVGSGKTLTSQMIAMEWRRLGKAKKPLIVTLKSVVPQYVREFRMAYPNAKILLPNDSDFVATNRKMLLSSIATGDYDAVVLSHEQMMNLQNPLELQNELVLDEIYSLQEAFKEVEDSNLDYKEKGRSKRQIQLAIEKLETNLAKLQDASKDDILGFDKLGIDGIIVDEAHYFKKLVYSTSMGSIKGMPDTSGSKRAFDLYVKTQYLLRSNPHKTVVFMTGTPITNTLPELYLLQKYLQADELKAQGIYHFDAWAKDYTEQTTEIELTSTGGLKEVTRLKEFKNLPTLIQTTRQFIDTVTNNDIKKSDVNFKLPPLKNGKVTEVYAEPSDEQIEFNLGLIKRIESFSKDNPDNHLAVFGDGAKMAIDMRLINSSFQDTPNSKVNLAVAKVFEKYKEFDSVKGTQLIFSDKGVPKSKDTKAKLEELIRKADEGNEDAQKALSEYNDEEIDDMLNGSFSVYSDMKSKLVKLGVPENEVVFIHDFDTKEKKEKLGQLVNSGAIRIVIGSTKKLGTGMNVQKRLIAVHHIDIPFTPAELEQRNGRIIRQGNELLKTIEGFEIEIVHYLTKRTLDAMNFQILQNKAKFIEQFYNGSMDGEVDIEEMSNSELAERIKAEASGNPLLIDKMRLEKQLKKLRRIARGQELANQQKASDIKQHEMRIKYLKESLINLDKDRQEIGNNKIVIDDKTVETRKEIGEALYDVITKYINAKAINPKEVGKIGDIKIEIQYSAATDGVKINFKSLFPNILEYTYTGQSIDGLGTKFVNKMNNYSDMFESYTNELPLKQEMLESLKNSKDGKFEKQTELDKTEKELSDVKRAISDAANPDKKTATEEAIEESTVSYSKLPTPKEEQQIDETNLYARANGYDEAGVNYVPNYSVSGIPERPLSGTVMLGKREIQLPTLDKPINADSLRVYLSEIVGNRLYDGKIKGKSALGVYQRKDSAIRVKNYSDVEVMAHEMAHFLDFFFNNKSKTAKDSFFRSAILKNKVEVKALSYTTDPKKVLSEGFAEFVRLWLTNYNTLTLVAPNMVKDFEARLAKDRNLQFKMEMLQEGMHQFYYQGADASLRSKQGGELNATAKKMQRSKAQISKEIRQGAIDKIHSIKRIEAEIRGDVAADALNSPYKILQLAEHASSLMHSAMHFGVPTVTASGDLAYSGKALNDIFAPATKVSEERVRLLSDYLVAKRADELMGQGREKLITKDEIKAGLALAQKYPEFETIFEEYQTFNDGMLDFYVAMNLITSSQKENFQEMNKNYVPFHRVTESVQNGAVPPAKIGQRLTGGTHSLGNIMENIINGLESNIKQAIISRGKSVFFKMLDDSDMGGVFATKVSTENKLVKSDIAQQAKKVARLMAELGVTVAKDGMIFSGSIDADVIVDVNEIEQNLLDNPSALEFWTHGHKPTSQTGYIETVIINDKKVYFEVHDAGLVDSLTSFSGANYNGFVQGLMMAKNVMTWNITNNPLFYFTNFARDTVSATVLSKNNFVPVMTSVRGMYHFVTKSDVYKAFMASGGGYGTRRTTLGGEADAMGMLEVNRGFEVIHKLLSAMAYGADVFEYGTRVGEFALSVKSGKSNMQGAFEGNEVSTDFTIKGSNRSWTGFLATVPFMKAAINGLDKTARRIFSLNGEMKLSNAVKFANQMGELQAHKLKFYVIGGILTGLTLALWLQNRDDERYKKLTRDSKLMYWHFFIGDEHIKIPRPYDIGFAFATMPEIVADGVYTKHGKDAAEDFVWGVKTMFSIGDVSGLFQPVLEHMTNKNWTGGDIIPSYLENLDDKSDQYMNFTPLLYKEFGKLTGASPILTQHYVDGYLGLTAKMVEETTENILWNEKDWGERPFAKNALEFMIYRFKGKDVEPRTVYSEKYYKLMEKASGVKASFEAKKKKAFLDDGKNITEYMSKEEKGAYVQVSKLMKSYGQTLTQIKNSVEHITYDKNLSRAEKEKLINDAYAARTDIFKGVSESLETELKKFEDK